MAGRRSLRDLLAGAGHQQAPVSDLGKNIATQDAWLAVFKNEQGRPLQRLSWWEQADEALADPAVLITALSLMRQSGKTTFCLQTAGRHVATVPNALVLFIAGSEGQGQELFGRKLRRPLVTALEALGVSKRRVVFTKRSVQLLDSGGRLEVLAPSEVSGVGRSATLLLFDEARYVPDSVFATLLPSVLASGGRVLVASSAPRPKDGGFFYRLLTDPPPEARVIRVEGDNENPAANPHAIGAVGRLLAKFSSAYYRREILNELVDDDEQALFPPALLERAIDPALGELPGSDSPTFVGVDLARRTDLASIVTVIREAPQRPDARDHLRVASILTWNPKDAAAGEVDFDEIRAALARLADRFPHLKLLVDEGSEGGSVLPFCRSHPKLSLAVTGFQATVDSNMAIWSALAARLHANTLTLPRHARLINELMNLRKEEIALGAKWRVLDSTKRFHRDVAVSLALAVHAAGEAGPAPVGGTLESFAASDEERVALAEAPGGFFGKIPSSLVRSRAEREAPRGADAPRRRARDYFFH